MLCCIEPLDMELSGSVYDSIHRDSRTVKTITLSRTNSRQNQLDSQVYHQISNVSHHPSIAQSIKTINFANSEVSLLHLWIFRTTKIKNLLLAFVCFLLSSPPSVMCAPSRDAASLGYVAGAQWSNPCGTSTVEDSSDYELMPFDSGLLKNINLSARIALDEAKDFREDYVNRTFLVDYKIHHNRWKNNHLSWLPNREELPKELGQNLNLEYLETLGHVAREQLIDNRLDQFDNLLKRALKDVYQYMQKIAIGFDQVVDDQIRSDGEFKDKFIQAREKLLRVLCEVQIALESRRVSTKGGVSLELMNHDIRNLENRSHRNLRDWLIFREYMNVLEYVIEVFSFIDTRYEALLEEKRREDMEDQ